MSSEPEGAWRLGYVAAVLRLAKQILRWVKGLARYALSAALLALLAGQAGGYFPMV